MSRTPRLVIPPAVGFVLLLVTPSFLRADQGAVRLSEKAGVYKITVFTSPTPFRAGPVDISVFLQDAASGRAVTNAEVIVRLTSRTTGTVLEVPATTEAATNRLLRAAVIDLPTPGRWDVEVAVKGPAGPATVRFNVEASEPVPRWLEMSPWFSWPVFVVAIFAIHQTLVRRRLRSAKQQRAERVTASGNRANGKLAK